MLDVKVIGVDFADKAKMSVSLVQLEIEDTLFVFESLKDEVHTHIFAIEPLRLNQLTALGFHPVLMVRESSVELYKLSTEIAPEFTREGLFKSGHYKEGAVGRVGIKGEIGVSDRHLMGRKSFDYFEITWVELNTERVVHGFKVNVRGEDIKFYQPRPDTESSLWIPIQEDVEKLVLKGYHPAGQTSWEGFKLYTLEDAEMFESLTYNSFVEAGYYEKNEVILKAISDAAPKPRKCRCKVCNCG